MKIILLIMISINLLLASDTFVDNETSLIWQDNIAVKSNKTDWQGAKNYCKALELAGYENWRLPDIKELQSIINIDRYNPAIIKGFKYINASGYCWSSSDNILNTKYAWMVYFKNGGTHSSPKSLTYHVRCVRDK